MNVEQLIDKLKEFDPKLEVRVWERSSDMYAGVIKTIIEVGIVKFPLKQEEDEQNFVLIV